MEQKKHLSGLSDAQVAESRKKHGANILTPPEKESLWSKFLGCFEDPIIRILLVALVLSIGISIYEFGWGGKGVSIFFEPAGILIAVLLATMVGFFLELSNEKTFQSLNEVNDDTLVKVIRNNNVCQIPRKDIVVGDIIILESGEEIPADSLLLESLSLLVDESSLTGEPQCTKTTKESEFKADATYPSNHIMKGTMILEGYCTAQVLCVGDSTACGKVFEAAQVQEGDATPLSEKLDWLAGMITKASYIFAVVIILGRLVRFAISMDNVNPLSLGIHIAVSIVLASIIFIIINKKKVDDDEDEDGVNDKLELYQLSAFMLLPIIAMFIYFIYGVQGGTDWLVFTGYALNTLMIAVTLIVVAVPEGLPMSVTLSLAFSMRKLMNEKTLPRTMHACETMGATSVICTDKTGTLTQNQMQVSEIAFSNDNEISDLICEAISTNTTAFLDFSDKNKVKTVGNPTEAALLLWLHTDKGIDYLQIREHVPFISRLPFSTENKYMATIVDSPITKKKTLYVKGAPEIVLSFCNIDDKKKQEIQKQLLQYQNMAMRTLGFAYIVIEQLEDVFVNGKLNIAELNFMGVVAISDPIRKEVPAAIKECIDAGIDIKIVTGDTPGTAKEIGRQIGLWKETDSERNHMTGVEFAAMSDEELVTRIMDLKILSRARPNDKERLVKLLKNQDLVVAVTGDGTNDAPALNAANVGLSMGDGTAVAKEASDMTIMDNSFSTISNAVMWGRSLYKNIQRFILFQLTINVAACFIVLVGAFLGTDSPLTVTQMLWVNLIMDTFAALALASLPPSHKVMSEKPRKVSDFIISSPMAKSIFGVGGIFFALLLGLVVFFQHNDVTGLTTINYTWDAYNGLSPYELSLFFTIFVMLQFWNIFNAKAFMTGKSAFASIGQCKLFLFMASVIFIGQLVIVTYGGEMFNVVPLQLIDWIIITASTSIVLWIGEIYRSISK